MLPATLICIKVHVKTKEDAAMPESQAIEDVRSDFLSALGERVRMLRSRRGMTRRAVAVAADVSERHLANLEQGVGNASILVLNQLAQALHCSLAELLGDATTLSPEWLLIRELLEPRSDADLRRARVALKELFGSGANDSARSTRIALVGLRGAGKSTLGAKLAQDLGYEFIELSREIERVAGCPVSEIHNLYGANAYRRYEHRALEEVIARYPKAVIAMPGGLVADSSSFSLMLSSCFTVWLQASPADHMARVIAQGDMRPMAANPEAMDDLKRILQGRAAFYSKADLSFDTSAYPLDKCFAALKTRLVHTLGAQTEA
jgi:XRE family transcriptional regulator, aerobic/anaerobic benzoate catabolism transcriptional regulator